jgi:hypothetical protein
LLKQKAIGCTHNNSSKGGEEEIMKFFFRKEMMKRCKVDKNLIRKLATLFSTKRWESFGITVMGGEIESHEKLSLRRLK